MICSVIQNRNLEEIFDLISSGSLEMAEIRLDKCPLTDEEIDTLFSSSDIPLVATCRVEGSESPKAAEDRLSIAIEAGAAFADLEIEAPTAMGKRLRRLCYDRGTVFIRSYHDFAGTPSLSDLRLVLDRCRKYGADLAKIVTTAASEEDVKTVASLYEGEAEGSIIAFCMGEAGRQSRLDALKHGAPYTYASLAKGEEAAPGQLTSEEMFMQVYGKADPYLFSNDSVAPCSKSFAQRAIVCAALADGTSHLRGFTACQDSLGALAVARALGAEVSIDGTTVTITGIGPKKGGLGLSTLNVLESGLLTRMMIPVLSAINGSSIVIEGTKTLLQRPLANASDIMASFGVMLTNAEPRPGKEIFVPVRIEGSLIPGKAEISGKGGSQLISGLLMSLPLCSKDSELFVTDPKSIPYMFITVDVLKKFGIEISSEMEGSEEFIETQDWSFCTGITFKIKGNQVIKAADLDLEGDWSSAAPFLVAGAVFGSARVQGLDTRSLQADLTIMDILVEAGASISQLEDQSIDVSKSPLVAFDFDLNNAPDLFPVVAVLAAFCSGDSHIAGVGRLVAKESNRAEAILEMLAQLGVNAHADGDVMTIEGHSLSWRKTNGKLLKGGFYTSRHDHRMVMALKVAALGAESAVQIDDDKCVAKSFPSFLEIFDN